MDLSVIRNKWNAAQKIGGSADVFVCADGVPLSGRYYLCNVGSVTASHDVFNGFAPSVGFPTDENGQSVNDRDYQNDKEAQEITRKIARSYDSRALQNVVVVSVDGVVLSGNGRTMAGELAANDGTDTGYINYLRANCSKYGFTPDDVARFKNPRVVFVPLNVFPYTAKTFAMFNEANEKQMNKTEQAIKYGKMIDNAVLGRIIATINGFETLGDFYGNVEAVTRCVNELRDSGAVNAMQYGTMFDGDGVSANGRELLENVLIGKAFETMPDCVRMLTKYKSVRKSVIYALGEIVNNLRLNDYSMKDELTKCVKLVFDARNAGYKSGEKVSTFARQMTIFGDTVSDYKNDVILLLADILNDDRTTMFKKLLTVYNEEAKDSANGQINMFSCSVRSKNEILDEVSTLFKKGSLNEQNAAISTAVESRVSDNLFLTDEQMTKIMVGGFCKLFTLSGSVCTVKVVEISDFGVKVEFYGGSESRVNDFDLQPCAEHVLSLPDWLKVGNVITNGHLSQKVERITNTAVFFVWINGGTFMVDLPTVIKNWQLSKTGICEVFEAA